jgi:two-component system sensor histidine kinase AlgZ
MKDSKILSVFAENCRLQPPATAVKAQVLVFDACHVGVVSARRAVCRSGGGSGCDVWLGFGAGLDQPRLSLFTGGALPATLVWLIAACSLKKVLARVSTAIQYAVGVALGALAGIYGCGLLALVGLVGNSPWIASAFSGALLSAALVAALVLRAKGTIACGHHGASFRIAKPHPAALSCSTRSTAPSPWCALSQPRQKPCWKT